VVDNGKSECDALRRRLRGIVNGSNPGIGLAEELMAREKRASMAVRSASEEEKIENRQTD
jgi:hypothetical protein